MEALQKAVKVFNDGGIIIFPTDTAFGIGCRIDNKQAIERLFKIRKRPETKAVPTLVSDLEMAKEYLQDIPDLVIERLIKPYWPGALTIILKCKKEKIPSLVRGGGETLGIRMPDNTDLLKIIQQAGVPILAPSANFAGDPTPYKFEDLDPELVKLVDYVVPGDCSLKQQSTVIDCSVEPWNIVRQGAVEVGI